MLLVADTHVHLYGFYSLEVACRAALGNLRRAHAAGGAAAHPGEAVAYGLFLTERHDCHAFKALRSRAPQPGWAGEVEALAGGSVLRLVPEAGGSLFLFPGRQIVTRERLEVLALTVDDPIPDRLPMAEAIERVRAAGGVPVIPWSPGKWFFGRGRIVADALQRAEPGTLAVGDTWLRPVGWPEPSLMRSARQRGLALVSGSDPLPFRGEERRAGACGTVLEVEDRDWATHPLEAVRRALLTGGSTWRGIGRRGSIPAVALRLWKNARSRDRL